MKFKNRYIFVEDNPTIIVGLNPGNQRFGSPYCWFGNKSANLLNKTLLGQKNIILTNACQYQEITDDNLIESISDVVDLIDTHKPRKIICLGNFSYKLIQDLNFGIDIIKLPHPSWVIRFNKGIKNWSKKLLEVLK